MWRQLFVSVSLMPFGWLATWKLHWLMHMSHFVMAYEGRCSCPGSWSVDLLNWCIGLKGGCSWLHFVLSRLCLFLEASALETSRIRCSFSNLLRDENDLISCLQGLWEELLKCKAGSRFGGVLSREFLRSPSTTSTPSCLHLSPYQIPYICLYILSLPAHNPFYLPCS